MTFGESDTRAKLIDPSLHERGWTENLISREETADVIETVDGNARKRSKDDLKAVNPHAKNDEDIHTPKELLVIIEEKGREVAEVIASLKEQVGEL